MSVPCAMIIPAYSDDARLSRCYFYPTVLAGSHVPKIFQSFDAHLCYMIVLEICRRYRSCVQLSLQWRLEVRNGILWVSISSFKTNIVGG